ncbi:MAG TPA: sigma-54 dependent transcriptional regulator [Candidatus Hydrogenedentes bacterium]|nr:sigma-54 dependent transcriptional regulator [Candidatus Hydrogenedentota bacterium]
MRSKKNTINAHILIACQVKDYGAAIARFLNSYGYQTERCHDAAGVLRNVGRRFYDVLVLDLDLAREGDVDLVSFIRQKNPDIQLILLFDSLTIERALEGIRQGAFFYLPKSGAPSDVAMVVEKALHIRSVETSAQDFEQTVFEELVGQTPVMQRVVEIIQKVAPTDSTVLLLGESGTGKEVLANAVHRLSRRNDKAFIAINCAALPEGLLESELFGHVQGAFTGAEHDKRGLFEEADGGTIFLDEIGDMSPITQAKLLRVLQSGEIRRVGASTAQKVDVRVIAATNRDLVEAVATHTFREDLYFRLNVIQIRIPPLRERMDALPALMSHFIARANARYGKNVRGMDDHAKGLLQHYDYPGNVRELESIIAHAVILADHDTIRARDLPEPVQFGRVPRLALPYTAEDTTLTLAQVEERHIRETLEKLNGNQSAAARRLGISRSTLWRKMSEYGIKQS